MSLLWINNTIATIGNISKTYQPTIFVCPLQSNFTEVQTWYQIQPKYKGLVKSTKNTPPSLPPPPPQENKADSHNLIIKMCLSNHALWKQYPFLFSERTSTITFPTQTVQITVETGGDYFLYDTEPTDHGGNMGCFMYVSEQRWRFGLFSAC